LKGNGRGNDWRRGKRGVRKKRKKGEQKEMKNAKMTPKYSRKGFLSDKGAGKSGWRRSERYLLL